jgi:hypothetical protein
MLAAVENVYTCYILVWYSMHKHDFVKKVLCMVQLVLGKSPPCLKLVWYSMHGSGSVQHLVVHGSHDSVHKSQITELMSSSEPFP